MKDERIKEEVVSVRLATTLKQMKELYDGGYLREDEDQGSSPDAPAASGGEEEAQWEV